MPSLNDNHHNATFTNNKHKNQKHNKNKHNTIPTHNHNNQIGFGTKP